MSSGKIHSKDGKNIINSQEHKPNISTAEFLVEPLWYNDMFTLVNQNGEYHTYNDFKQNHPPIFFSPQPLKNVPYQMHYMYK